MKKNRPKRRRLHGRNHQAHQRVGPNKVTFADVAGAEEEKEEQQRLRQKYIQAFRASLESTLDTVYVEEEDGQAVPIKEYMKEKYGGAEAEKN